MSESGGFFAFSIFAVNLGIAGIYGGWSELTVVSLFTLSIVLAAVGALIDT